MTIASNGSNGKLSTPSNEETSKPTPTVNLTVRPDREHSDHDITEPKPEVGMEEMMDAVRTMLLAVGEDPDREGLLKTPKRVAEAMRFLTSGYNQSLEELVNGAIFDEGHNEMVLVRDINFFSQCEHHMLPFMGRAHVAYLPGGSGSVCGLSKIAVPTSLTSPTRRLLASANWPVLWKCILVVCKCKSA